MESLRVSVLSSSHVLISVFFDGSVSKLLLHFVGEVAVAFGDFSRGLGGELSCDLGAFPCEVLFHPTIHVGCLPDILLAVCAFHLIDTSLSVNIPSLFVEHRCSRLSILCCIVDWCASNCSVHAFPY